MERTRRVVIEVKLASATGRNRLQGVLRYLRGKCDWDIRLPQSEEDLRRELSRPVDGIIVSRIYATDILRRLECIDTPVVFMDIDRRDRRRYRVGDVTIANDNGGIGLLAANHLATLGRFRSFGFVPHHLPHRWSDQRGKGFAMGLQKRRLKMAALDRRRETLVEWLGSLELPAAIFAACDETAREVLMACREMRLKVPDQIALLGADDDELVCTLARPGLSSIRLDTEGEGFKAAEALHRLMEGDLPQHPRTILMRPLGVTDRASTRPPPPAMVLIREALAYMATEATKGATVDDVARNVGCSRRLLSLRFSQFHDETIHAALTRFKLEAVRRALKDGDRRINQIAQDCGFKSAAVLRNLFRRTYGCSMSAWRR